VFAKLLGASVLALLVAMVVLGAMGVPVSKLLLGLLPGIGVAAVLAFFGSRYSEHCLAPIRRFARSLAAGDLSARVAESQLAGDSPEEIAVTAMALDEAARRMAESFSLLERHRSQLAVLLDSMQEAVIAIDGDRQVTWCNAAMRKIAASPVQEGRSLAHAIRDPEVLSSVELALLNREARRARVTAIAPGKIFEVTAAPMPEGGAVAVLHDVSEIERAEIARRDFVANVSHELRTPLTCVTGYVETLLDDPGMNRQAREFLQIILKNSSRMTRLTEDLLALASVESKDYKLNLQATPASDLVEDAVASLDGRVMDSDVTLEIGETAQGSVMADSDALQQVFGNLVENARKYGKAGKRVVLGSRNRDRYIEFYVQDFGSGIAYEHIPRIFERFYRVDKARSRESGGTGLGLAIAKHIVLAHGGDIRCESELGNGATFLFRLPALSIAGPPASSPAPEAEIKGRSMPTVKVPQGLAD
jgi:two-component system phosphate regulon sensor histidine kinase PhoR